MLFCVFWESHLPLSWLCGWEGGGPLKRNVVYGWALSMCSSVLSLAQAMDVSIRSLEEEEGKKDADGLTIGGITENFAKGGCKFFQVYGHVDLKF